MLDQLDTAIFLCCIKKFTPVERDQQRRDVIAKKYWA